MASILKVNPYSPDEFEPAILPRRLIGKAAIVIVYLYPLIVLLFLYATWGLSAIKLGRLPKPYLEYPEGAELVVLGGTTALLQLIAPLAIPIGLFISVVYPFADRNRQSARAHIRVFSLLTYITICAVALIVLFSDPYRVVDWFWD